MTEEEKKAVEYYSDKEVSFEVDFDTKNLLKALGITEEDSFENHKIRFKTLLNLITKLRQENEELTTALSKQSKDIGNYLVELQQKDKQIDLMAEFINKQDIDEDICKNNMSDLCDEFGTGINCIKCIKQYFEKLAKEKKIKYE